MHRVTSCGSVTPLCATKTYMAALHCLMFVVYLCKFMCVSMCVSICVPVFMCRVYVRI
jgi:hypothetical protein